jgi:hypothetical protein
MEVAAALKLATAQIEFAREYTLALLADIDDPDWYRMPPGAVTHLAWQTGHIAMAQYGLCLFRQRGRRPEDLELMPSKFRKLFSRGSQVQADPAAYPTPGELRAAMNRIHEQCLTEMAGFSPDLLTEPIDMPYMVYPNKLGALLFCSHHEMLHAGQIGLLRRLLGKQPLR